jgi:hypothetical protein
MVIVRHEAEVQLDKFWSEVEALAERLLIEPTMSGRRAREVMDASIKQAVQEHLKRASG